MFARPHLFANTLQTPTKRKLKQLYSRVIQYQDLDNNEKEQIFWFNLSLSEAMLLQTTYEDGPFIQTMEAVVRNSDEAGIIKMFITVIEKSYGKRHPDGEQFDKSPEMFKAFRQTDAYERLFAWLIEIENFQEFMNSIVKPEYIELMKQATERTTAQVAEIKAQSKKISDIPKDELLKMPESEFFELAGPKGTWNRRTTAIASQRKTATLQGTVVS